MKTIKHLYHYSETIVIDCDLKFDPGESACNDIESGSCGPGWPPAAYLIRAKVGGVDILPLLEDSLIETIEGLVCCMQ